MEVVEDIYILHDKDTYCLIYVQDAFQYGVCCVGYPIRYEMFEETVTFVVVRLMFQSLPLSELCVVCVILSLCHSVLSFSWD